MVDVKFNYACVKTIALLGMEAIEIKVEVHIGNGLPNFIIVGLPDKNISESKERIRAAFKTLSLNFPSKRITVNMSPSNLPKEGSHYDLPIALGILVALNMIDQDLINNWLVVGELSLDGTLNDVKGVLLAAIFASQKGYKLICPVMSSKQVYLSGNHSVLVFNNLLEILSYQKGYGCYNLDDNVFFDDVSDEVKIDMSDVVGQDLAKRVLEIAAVFKSHVLMIGAPGVGKSMLAKRMKTILPDLTSMEKLEVSMIYSVCDKLNVKYNYDIPYRNPHHTSSMVALIGGGSKASPGEISLSHNGVLFLDELGEFYNCLDGLRECMETKEVVISRAGYHIKYPANCQIIAAMNPCKCGYLDTQKQCNKAPNCSKEYMKKISGPLFERFDLVVYMNNNVFFSASKSNETSAIIKERVERARNLYKQLYSNDIIDLKIDEYWIDLEAKDFLLKYVQKKKFSMRVYNKILKISLAISLLDYKNSIAKKHVAEACLFYN